MNRFTRQHHTCPTCGNDCYCTNPRCDHPDSGRCVPRGADGFFWSDLAEFESQTVPEAAGDDDTREHTP